MNVIINKNVLSWTNTLISKSKFDWVKPKIENVTCEFKRIESVQSTGRASPHAPHAARDIVRISAIQLCLLVHQYKWLYYKIDIPCNLRLWPIYNILYYYTMLVKLTTAMNDNIAVSVSNPTLVRSLTHTYEVLKWCACDSLLWLCLSLVNIPSVHQSALSAVYSVTSQNASPIRITDRPRISDIIRFWMFI